MRLCTTCWGCAPWGPPSLPPAELPLGRPPETAAWSFPTRPSWRRGRIGSPTRGWRKFRTFGSHNRGLSHLGRASFQNRHRSKPGPPARGSTGLRTLQVGSPKHLWGAAPRGAPPTTAGSPAFFGRSRRKEHQGGQGIFWDPLRWAPKIGDAPEPRRELRLGRSMFCLRSRSKHDFQFSFPACGRGNSARRALPGESIGRKHWMLCREAPTSKAFPRGEGGLWNTGAG